MQYFYGLKAYHKGSIDLVPLVAQFKRDYLADQEYKDMAVEICQVKKSVLN